jgi:hypothetical protein
LIGKILLIFFFTDGIFLEKLRIVPIFVSKVFEEGLDVFWNSAADADRKWSDPRWREIDKDARGDAVDGVVAGDSDLDNGVITSTELPHCPAGQFRSLVEGKEGADDRPSRTR